MGTFLSRNNSSEFLDHNISSSVRWPESIIEESYWSKIKKCCLCSRDIDTDLDRQYYIYSND